MYASMKAFWKGFLSVFDFGGQTTKVRIPKKVETSWYHNGPWWEHPLWGDTWKRK
jgi:hypothetical protein